MGEAPFSVERGQHGRGQAMSRGLFVVQLAALVARVAGEVDLQALENIVVHLRKNDGGVCFAALEQRKLAHGDGGVFIRRGANGERDENFIRMKARVMIA